MKRMLMTRRRRREKRGAFAAAGDLLASQLLQSLCQDLRGPLVENESIDHAQLNAEKQDDQAGQKVLIAVQFHRTCFPRCGDNATSIVYRTAALADCKQPGFASVCRECAIASDGRFVADAEL